MLAFGSNCEHLEEYSYFLHDGDFEKYQPNTNLTACRSREYLVASMQAEKEMTRGLWILNRLTRYGDTHWSLLVKETQLHYDMILYYEKQIKAYDDYSRAESEARTKNNENQTKTLVPISEIRSSDFKAGLK